jgi:hypothetical protein
MNRTRRRVKLALLVLGVTATVSAVAVAQHDHHHPASASHPSGAALGQPTEVGQGAFAALAEIVSLLERDPSTDWEKVDIGALRDHLVDMERLTVDAEVTESAIEGGLEILVGGPAAAVEAARRMVPAHAAMVAGGRGWKVRVEDRGPTLRVLWTTDDPGGVARIRGLGLFGMIATGDHHQPHHWSIASGRNPH